METSSDSADNSHLLVSTLIKVTEQFLASVNLLKREIGSDPNTYQQQLLSVMEHYDRLNLVMKVLKVAHPTQINTPNENNVINTAMKNVTATVSNTLAKMNEIPVKPTHADASPVHTESNPLHSENKPVHTAKLLQTEDVPPPPPPPPPPVKVESTQIQPPESSQPKPNIKVKTKASNISSSVFLDQFEKTAQEFAAQHNIAMEQVWEPLLIHALPKDKIEWAKANILQKNMKWKTARRYYLNAYPDIYLQKPQKKLVDKPFSMPVLVKTSALSRTNQPSHSPNTTHETTQTRERQSRYAEYLLSIEMKEYESIAEFNSKFYRYATIACMNLNDISLSRRYVSSLLPKYRLLVERGIQQHPPHNLKETMALASRVIIPLEKTRKSHGEACWKHPDTTKRNNLEDTTRPLKRFCA